ncbi:pyridoxamine 5'-phosphate oxidase family protein [Spirochaetota bacterium]
MRDMTREEIISFIKKWTWGTLIGVESAVPYAVEVSYGTDGEYIYCGTRPGGRMSRCIRENQNVVFKICDSDRSCSRWYAVIVEGIAERMTGEEDVLYSVRRIAAGMGLRENAFDAMAKEVAKNGDSNSLRIPLTRISGKTIGH